MVNNITFDKISDLTGQKGVIGVNLGGSARVRDSLNVLKNIKTGLLDVDNISISGNISIGSAASDDKLHIDGGGIVSETIAYGNSQNDVYLVAGSTNYTGETTNWGTYGFQHRIKSDESGVARVTIDGMVGGLETEIFCVNTSGRIGIGTDDPAAPCHIEGASDVKLRLSDTDSTDVDSICTYVEFYDQNDRARAGYVGFGSATHAHFDIANQTSSGELRFFTNSIERVSIDASNNVTLGLDGTQQGKLVMHRKDADEFPYIKMHSSDGTASYLFVANNGTLRIHDSAPTADGDGSAV